MWHASQCSKISSMSFSFQSWTGSRELWNRSRLVHSKDAEWPIGKIPGALYVVAPVGQSVWLLLFFSLDPLQNMQNTTWMIL